MRVSKIGGSLLSEGSVLSVINSVIKRDLEDNRLILVVSAMKSVTDDLIMAYENKNQVLMDKALGRYINEANALGLNHLVRFLDYVRHQLRELLSIREPWARDYFIVHGELLSAMLIEDILRDVFNINAKAIYNPGIITDESWGEANVLPESHNLVKQVIGNVLSKYDVVVIPGFLGVSGDGKYTALGRGGSDYTASLIAAYLNVSKLTYYTDSGGVLSGDPNIVNNPVLVPSLNYEEAHAASKVGAKKFHPKTFEPLMKNKVKTFITSPWTLEGTYIVDHCIQYPKVVSLRRINDGEVVVSVVGCIMDKGEYRDDVMELIADYEPVSIIEMSPNLLSISVKEWDTGVKLTRELHEWVRKWIA